MLALAAGSSSDAAANGQPVGATLQLAPPEGKTVTEVTPVTFGVVFPPGELARGQSISARLAGAEIPVLLDAKRHYPDGSVKHGVVSLLVPKLEGAAALQFFAESAARDRPTRTCACSSRSVTIYRPAPRACRPWWKNAPTGAATAG